MARKSNKIKENEEATIETLEEKEKQDLEENVSNTKHVEKLPIVKEIFKDKYDERVIYNLGDVFIKDEKIEDKKPVKVEDGKYKVSKERYEELKRSLYVD